MPGNAFWYPWCTDNVAPRPPLSHPPVNLSSSHIDLGLSGFRGQTASSHPRFPDGVIFPHDLGERFSDLLWDGSPLSERNGNGESGSPSRPAKCG